MNVLICGGKAEADYVLNAYAVKGNHIVVINDDDATAERISEHYGLDVFKSDPTKIYSFEVADVANFDLVVALAERDVDNFVICTIAKELFDIKKAICTVTNPNNVNIFKRMGIDTPISASYLLSQTIKGESDVDSIIRTLSLENEKITITEINIDTSFPCCGKTIAAIRLPETGNITCIFRNPDVIIPRGNTYIEAQDTLVIASSPENQEYLINYIKYGPDEELKRQRAVEEQERQARQAEIEAEKKYQQELMMKEAVARAKVEYAQEQEDARKAAAEEEMRKAEEAARQAELEAQEQENPAPETSKKRSKKSK